MNATTEYDYDLEFLEDGKTIELISIGIVADDGREYYAVNRDAPWKRIAKHEWLMGNVVPSLPRLHGDERLHRWILSRAGRRHNPCMLDFAHPHMRDRDLIADQVRDFLYAADAPVLWADCDIQQEALRLGARWDELPQQTAGLHNALEDARHNVVKRRYLADLAQLSGGAR